MSVRLNDIEQTVIRKLKSISKEVRFAVDESDRSLQIQFVSKQKIPHDVGTFGFDMYKLFEFNFHHCDKQILSNKFMYYQECKVPRILR